MTRTTLDQGLELWQDARRTPEQYSAEAPDTFEWWYFDANLSDGHAVVVTMLVEPDAVQGALQLPHDGQRDASGRAAAQGGVPHVRRCADLD